VAVSAKIVTSALLEQSATRCIMDKIFMQSEVRDAERYFREQGFDHLRARHRGKVVTLESGPEDDVVKHARFRKDTVHLWILEIADHQGRFEPTGLRDTIENLRVALIENFPWLLEKIV